MLDVRILQTLREQTEYNKLRAHVPERALDPQTKVILDDFGAYFKEFGGPTIDYHTFVTWFEKFRHPKLNNDQRAVYRNILHTVLVEELPPGTRAVLLKNMNELKTIYDLKSLIAKWEDGECPDFSLRFADVVQQSRAAAQATSTWVQPDIEAFLANEMNEDGLHWPLLCMEAVTKPLRPGDFIIVGGRPGIGKTSWLTFLIAHFLKYLPEDKNVVWLNNEGPGNKINARFYQAVLKKGVRGLCEMLKEGTLHDAYLKEVGREDRFQVHDVHGKTMAQCTAILEESNPGIIVYDMLANIRADADSDRSDLAAEARAQWARESQVRFESVGIATWQISNEGDNNLFPPMGALMNSKTALQGACDMIMMLGASNANGMNNVRGLGVVKTKMQREGTSGDPHATLQFDRDTAQYKEIDEEYGNLQTTELPEDY